MPSGTAFGSKATEDAPRKKSESWEPSAASARSLSGGSAARPALSLGPSLVRDLSLNRACDLGVSQVSDWDALRFCRPSRNHSFTQRQFCYASSEAAAGPEHQAV